MQLPLSLHHHRRRRHTITTTTTAATTTTTAAVSLDRYWRSKNRALHLLTSSNIQKAEQEDLSHHFSTSLSRGGLFLFPIIVVLTRFLSGAGRWVRSGLGRRPLALSLALALTLTLTPTPILTDFSVPLTLLLTLTLGPARAVRCLLLLCS